MLEPIEVIEMFSVEILKMMLVMVAVSLLFVVAFGVMMVRMEYNFRRDDPDYMGNAEGWRSDRRRATFAAVRILSVEMCLLSGWLVAFAVPVAQLSAATVLIAAAVFVGLVGLLKQTIKLRMEFIDEARTEHESRQEIARAKTWKGPLA